MLFYHKSVEDTFEELRSGPDGISRIEANKRLKTYGSNTVRIKGEPLWRTLVEPFANVFMLVLFLAAAISVIHQALFDALIIIAIMLISASIYYVQKFSTERILRSLQKHTAQQVEVIRGGEVFHIDSSQLVPGDVVKLSEGNKIPADIRLTTASSLRVDESILTGESLPVNKTTGVLGEKKEVYEQENMLFQGSFVISGQATGIVVYTGNQTEFGRIATLSKKTADTTMSPVQKKIDKLLSYIIAVVAALAIIAFILAVIRGVELTEALRFVMALSVSAVPESLPIAISVILVLGMRRMAAKKALVRTMQAIETIGVITTIATDKTGTLTENKLSVQETWQPKGNKYHLPTVAHRTINYHSDSSRDPLDVALSEFTNTEKSIELKGESFTKLPFDQEFAMSGNVWQHERRYDLVIKGAPEQVMERSHLTKPQQEEAEAALQKLTSQGYRVIALASTKLDTPLSAFKEMHAHLAFDFVGFMAVADTLRPVARHAIQVAQRAGVSVRMITGDHFETAFRIGQQLGLVESREQVFDSRLMNDMTDKELKAHIYDARVFSRVTPENKFRILQILKLKEVTAMTGDGVNDIPALSSANVGVAMGSGSQIAKDAGDIILLNNNFESIVRAMREGRVIFANIRRMLYYLLSSNTAEAVIMVASLAIGLPLPLVAVQILWINLVSETSIVIPLGLEPGEKDVMEQKPIVPGSPLLSRYMISRIAIVAVTMTALCLGMYAYFLGHEDIAYGQTIVFTSLVAMVWANAFNARSTYESVFSRLRVWSGAFFTGLSISITLQVIAVFGPLKDALHVAPVSLTDLAVTSIIAFVAIILVVEIHKFFGRRFISSPIE